MPRAKPKTEPKPRVWITLNPADYPQFKHFGFEDNIQIDAECPYTAIKLFTQWLTKAVERKIRERNSVVNEDDD